MPDDENLDAEALTKGVTLTPVLTALFKPTAEYLGNELRDAVRTTVERLKSQRREHNFKTHVAAVRDRMAKESPRHETGNDFSFRQAELLGDCLESVQEVDPLDKELSELWQSLLAAAANGKDVSREALQALKTLTPAEAVLLLELRDGRDLRYILFPWDGVSGRERILIRSLASKGFIERGFHRLRFGYFLVIALGTSVASVILLSQPVFSDSIKYWYLSSLAFVCLVLVIIGANEWRRWRLTWLGEEVTKYAIINSNQKPNVAGTSPNTATASERPRKICGLSHTQISDALEQSPPMQRDRIASSFLGKYVQWRGKLFNASRYDDTASISLNSICERGGLVHCTSSLVDSDVLLIAAQGTEVVVTGRIKRVSTHEADLEDCQFEIINKD